MRAAVYFKHGRPEEVLQTVDVPEPDKPGRGEVLVRVLLRPVHHGDLLGISGRYQPGMPVPESGVRVGFEGYGLVEQAGDGVDLKPGTRVAFFPGRGAWSEKAVVPAEYVTVIPDAVSDEAAAQLHVNPLTAALLLRAVENAGAGLNTADDEYEALPSPDGRWMLLSAADAYFRSARTPDGWSPRVRLGPEINANGSEIGAAFSPSGKSWLFARDMKDGRSGELLLAGEHEHWPQACPGTASG